jgi:hypothetical protein
MNAHAHIPSPSVVPDIKDESRLSIVPDIEDVFRLRAWARAYLFAVWEIELQEAVDVLQEDAEAMLLVQDLGADRVQEIITAAFGHDFE